MKRSTCILLCFAFFAISAFPAFAQIQLARSVFGNGGSPTAGGSFALNGTLGQSVIGVVSGPNLDHRIGFWVPGSIATSVDDQAELPTIHQLGQNQPNPFNPVTTIRYAIPSAERVSMRLYDVNGRLVRELIHEEQSPGYYEFTLDASRLASGVYFYRLEAGRFLETKKMVLLK